MNMKINLLLLILISLACADKSAPKLNAALFLPALFGGASNSPSPTPETSGNETKPVAASPSSPESTIAIPATNSPVVVTPTNPTVNPPPVLEFKITSNVDRNDWNSFGANGSVRNLLYPPEGWLDRSIQVQISNGDVSGRRTSIDCASIELLPLVNGSNNFINGVSIWKKNSDGSFSYFSDAYTSCNDSIGITSINIFPKSLSLMKHNVVTDIANYNAMWFEPNTTYRILVSNELVDRLGRKVSLVNSEGNINGIEGRYYGIEFNTAERPDYKAFLDGWEDTEIVNYMIPYNATQAVSSSASGLDYSNCIEAVGIDFFNKSNQEVHNLIPELKNISPVNDPIRPWGKYCQWKAAKFDSTSREITQVNVLGSCIKNPAKSNEYRISYAKGFGFNSDKLKNDCRCGGGLWRDEAYSWTTIRFNMTRWNPNAVPERPPVCCKDDKEESPESKLFN
jgi:hypothetical protein